jgi:hypothetical protein
MSSLCVAHRHGTIFDNRLQNSSASPPQLSKFEHSIEYFVLWMLISLKLPQILSVMRRLTLIQVGIHVVI